MGTRGHRRPRRALAGATLLLGATLLAAPAAAGGPRSSRRERHLHALPYVFLPIDPAREQPLYFFGGRPSLLPGVVSVNRPPYVCDLEGKTFTDDQRFVAHLHVAHHLPFARIPEAVLVYDGQVHFAGE